jgi:hypothetical protein
LGCNLVEAVGLLVGVLIAESAELFLVVAPCHVVLALTPGMSLDLLLMSFSFLGRCLLPVLIFLLLLLVSVVLLVLLFLVVSSTLLLASFPFVIFGYCCLLEVGSQLESAPESGKFCLHCHDLVFVRRLSSPCSFLLQQVEFIGGQHDEFFVHEGECPISVGILLVLDVASEIVAWDDHVCREEDVDKIVNCCTAGNDLSVVGVKVGVEQLNVSLDGRAIGR